MKRSQLRELAKTVGVTITGTNANVADRLISKFEDMRSTNSDVMIVESFFYFAFKGFPRRTDYNAAYHRIKEFIFDFFDDVDICVDVIGVHEGLEMVGLKGNSDYADRIRQKVHEQRDKFTFKGVYLTTVDLSFEIAQSFNVLLNPPLPEAIQLDATRHDPMQESDPWKTPPRASKSAAHTGWTPEMQMRKRQMEELLARHRDVPSPLEVPRPSSTAASSDDNVALILAKLTELTVGVNELRASQAHAITRSDLQEFHKAFNAEHKALLASQIEPLRNQVSDLSAASTSHNDRLRKLETQIANAGSNRKSVDSYVTKLAVNKLPEKCLWKSDWKLCAISWLSISQAFQLLSASSIEVIGKTAVKIVP